MTEQETLDWLAECAEDHGASLEEAKHIALVVLRISEALQCEPSKASVLCSIALSQGWELLPQCSAKDAN